MDYSDVKVGTHVMIKEYPCKVLSVDISKTGKHGHGKKRIHGIDILTDKKPECILRSGHRIEIPTIKSLKYQLQYIDESDFMHLYNEKEGVREDIALRNFPLDEEVKELYIAERDLELNIIEVSCDEKLLGYRILSYTKNE